MHVLVSIVAITLGGAVAALVFDAALMPPDSDPETAPQTDDYIFAALVAGGAMLSHLWWAYVPGTELSGVLTFTTTPEPSSRSIAWALPPWNSAIRRAM